MNWYDKEGKEILTEPPYELEKNEVKDKETPGRIRKTNEDTWRNLIHENEKDHEMIRENLNDAPVRLEDYHWKLRMNKHELMDSG